MGSEMKVNAGLIKRLREERGWSQEHLAAVSGLSARTVQRLESDGNASRESRLALAAAFGVEASALNAAQGHVPVGKTADSAVAEWLARLGPWADPRVVRVLCFLIAAWFIYQAGRAVGESWYYFTH